ncbi:glycosyltransferase family 39 protein [Caulobacter sp. S45]|uniref:ArnT family glycosyltransferase n=1 Tax=Caulobacter sp. S45 TaxID=1641861 RepID=UPI001577276D|nr:glycosyltransferase family 39 protein [Caulobacter sp. S45]
MLTAVLAGCGAFLFIGVRTVPIVLWDESRNAVNALEMHQRGLSLVTTYGGRPDLWNTKPPLLIWSMWTSMAVFGPSEWSVRLPSMMAAMATLALTFSFTRRVTGSVSAAALSTFLLVSSLNFFGEFGARTGDYDALLGLFTTGYLHQLFFAVHRRKPGAGHLMAVALLVSGAVLTKSVMGLLPGVGVAAYLLLTGRWRRPMQSPWYAAAGLAAVLPVAAFVLLREHAAPGYLRAAMTNDLGGRFGAAVEGHLGPPSFYLDTVFGLGLFSAGVPALLAPLGMLTAKGVARQGLMFALCVVVGVIVLLSLSATKLAHYASPALPFLAIACALAIREGLRALRRRGQAGRFGSGLATAVLALGLGLIACRAAWLRLDFLPGQEFRPKALYGELFRSLEQQGVRAVDVVEGGVGTLGWRTDGVPTDYAPQLRFYTLLAGEQGLRVRRITPDGLAAAGPGDLVASCDPAFWNIVSQRGADLSTVAGCKVVRSGAPPPIARRR